MSRTIFILPFLNKLKRGIETSGLNLSSALSATDYTKIYIFSIGRINETIKKQHPKISFISIPDFRYYKTKFASFFYFFHFINIRPNNVVIYFAGHGEAWPLILYNKIRRFNLVFLVGYPFETTRHRFEEFKKLGLANYINHIIVKSKPMKNKVSKFFNKDVQVLTNGIDIEKFKPNNNKRIKLREEFGFNSKVKIIITVAALEERKGIQHVLRALDLLKKEKYNFKYLIIGTGNFEEKLKSLCNNLNLKDQVQFLGVRNDVNELYNISDLFILLSYGEGFPNVLLEAWSMNLPVITSKHKPFPSISNNHTYNLNELNSEKIAETIKIAIKSYDGQFNRHHVISNYKWSEIALKFFQIINTEK